ncbi:MAG: alpha/beta fold hydrolase [Bacteroidota bacterium]
METTIWLVLGLLLVTVYTFWPWWGFIRPSKSLPAVPQDLTQLASWINTRESHVPFLKADNEARILFAEPGQKKKTALSVVYLHGFSASQGEGAPLHEAFAKKFGFNLYLHRLPHHGQDEPNALLHLKGKELLESAQEALAIGQQLGEKVILMATSTGASLALYLAAHFPEKIEKVMCYSPNIRLRSPLAFLLARPGGLWILRAMYKGKFRVSDKKAPGAQYWNVSYRLEAVVSLQKFLERWMRVSLFRKVKVPVWIAYYYKNDAEQDETVSVKNIHWMYRHLGSQEKWMENFPEAGDHALLSPYWSASWEEVQEKSLAFGQQYTSSIPASSPSEPRISD